MSDLLTERLGELFKSRPWYKLPRLLAMLKLVEIRDELREEEPARHRGAAARAEGGSGGSRSGAARGTEHRRHVQRSACSEDGRGGLPFRPQRAAPAHVPGHAEPAGPQPEARQPRADDARPVPAGDDPEPAGGLVDPVHGARLVRARSLEDRAHRHPDRAPATTGARRACRCRAPCPTRRRRDRRGRRPTPISTATGGTRRRSTAAATTWPRSCARTAPASSASSRPACCRSTPTPASTSPASATTGGSAWRCSTRSSRWSTTTSAICSLTITPTGTTNSCFARPS